jgi:hypothetical protein
MSYIGNPRKGFNVMAYNQQKLDREKKTNASRDAKILEYIEMAQSRLRAAMMGDEPCKPCIDLAASYLQEATTALTSGNHQSDQALTDVSNSSGDQK